MEINIGYMQNHANLWIFNFWNTEKSVQGVK